MFPGAGELPTSDCAILAAITQNVWRRNRDDLEARTQPGRHFIRRTSLFFSSGTRALVR